MSNDAATSTRGVIEVEVDSLRPSEAVAATDLLRRAFAPDMIEHGTVRCSGYATYLRDQLATPLPRAVDVWGARHNSKLCGVLVANRRTSSSHLAYVAVDPGARGQGIARTLTDTWIAASTSQGCTTLTLDVVAGNEPARRLYADRGFALTTSRRTTVTSLARLTGPAIGEPWWSDDLTSFLGSFHRYGFGRLRLVNSQGYALTIGMLDSGFVQHPVSSELRSAAHILQLLIPEGKVLSAEPETNASHKDAILRLEKQLSPRHGDAS